MARFVVGIDLGTTNSSLSFAEVSDAPDAVAEIRSFLVPQVSGTGEVKELPVLPSFLYLPTDKEVPAGASRLPWSASTDRITGAFARDQGAKVPTRLVSSAKSWLSHQGIDPRRPLLPTAAGPDQPRISPLDASAAYLAHLRDAWDTANPTSLLRDQDVYLTVPASFDAAARELTVEAAKLAGLEKITLLEEPQAAFHAWLASRGDAWRKAVKVGDLILVCDVGGGTTDFTLIGVTDRDGDLELTRVAVGEHILLGGDNMDLALAHAVGATLPGGMESLDRAQQAGLALACRSAKEALFADPRKTEEPVTVLGRGSKVVGGSIKTSLTRAMLDEVLLEGFLPRCAASDRPARSRRVGLTEIGLPYAADAGITRHLARFLGRQAGSLHQSDSEIHPSAILFNGGVFKAEPLRTRLSEVLQDWSGKPVPNLDHGDLDLAVSRGAVYYGLSRMGKGIRIRGGIPRAYYVGIETSAPAVPGVPPPIKALCVASLGMEEGTRSDVPGPEMGLIVGEPAVFRFLGSTTRREDAPGTLLDRWNSEEIQELAPIEATLPTDERSDDGDIVPIALEVHVTEVGTLDLWCRSTRDERRWKLEYNVREHD